MATRFIISLATGAHRASEANGREDLALLPERLDQIDAWIEDGLLDSARAQRRRFPDCRQRRRCSCCPTTSRHSSRDGRWRRSRAASPPATPATRRRPCRPTGSRRCATARPSTRAPRRALAAVPSSMTATRLSRAERSAHTRRELLDAAERRFFTDGYHGTTLDDIADEAGYTKGAVYSTFKSKGGLFVALFDEVVDRRIEEIRLLLDEHEGVARSPRSPATRSTTATPSSCCSRSSSGSTRRAIRSCSTRSPQATGACAPSSPSSRRPARRSTTRRGRR